MSRTPRLRWLSAFALTICLTSSMPLSAQEAAEEMAPPPSKETAAAPGVLEDVSAVRREANTEGVASQKRVDTFSDETDTLFAKYSTTLKQIDSINVYNQQMRQLIGSQEAELASLEDQLDRVELVGRSVTPLMLRMIEAVKAFVSLDVPFLEKERQERMDGLDKVMARADVSNAEKYRAIMEAYQIENEYGRTIEAYRSTLEVDGQTKTVDFLRFGRIALVYQTLDGSESAVWDQKTRQWVPLDDGYRTSIRAGLKIARKQSAPDLIRLPLPAAVDAQEAS